MPISGVPITSMENKKTVSLYIFSGSTTGSSSETNAIDTTTNDSNMSASSKCTDVNFSKMWPKPTSPSNTKTHMRSASHGAVLANTTSGWQPVTFKEATDELESEAPSMAATCQQLYDNPKIGFGSTASKATIQFGRPSALKKSGHQRAFSQGQMADVPRNVTGHSRVGSKTDFILPPGHREEPRPSNVTSKAPSFRGHSRQASR